jgi:hypothetical protein
LTPRNVLFASIAVCVAGAAAALAGITVDDDEPAAERRGASASASTPAPTRPPDPPADRDATLWPFSADSPWNTPLGAGVELEPEDGPMTTALRIEEDDDGDRIATWVNSEEFSIPVVLASEDDPVVEIDDSFREDATIYLPDDAGPAAGTDGHLVVIRPDRRTADEFFSLEEGDDGWTSERHHVTDLHGLGIGPQAGVRAYGGSALGGLIRAWEVDPEHPDHDGVIRHALAVALPAMMLRYDGGEPGYDGDGYGTATGYTWPATEQDYDSPEDYEGPIPMGTLVAIPPDVDVDALGLPAELVAIGRALQDYGAYVVDRAAGVVAFYAEPGVPDSWLDVVRGPNASTEGLERLRGLLRVVTNNAPSSVGGGGERAAPAAPPFR